MSDHDLINSAVSTGALFTATPLLTPNFSSKAGVLTVIFHLFLFLSFLFFPIKFSFPLFPSRDEVLQARSLQRSLDEMARSKKEGAREACDLLLVSLYCNILPGRGLEVRTLQVVQEAELTEPFVPAHFQNRNVALVHKEGGLTIHVQRFKTYHCAGKDTVPIEVCCQLPIPTLTHVYSG